jgi:hypothetical protein
MPYIGWDNREYEDLEMDAMREDARQARREAWQAMQRKGGVPMQNVTFEVQGGQLVIVVDLSHELGESASGKSIIIATTGGNVSVPGYEDVKVGLNVYRPVQAVRTARRSR